MEIAVTGALLPVPLIGPRLLFGKHLVDELMLASQRVRPSALTTGGFSYQHETLEAALGSMLRK